MSTIRGTAVFEYVALTWTASALSALFDQYELQRSDDAGTTWNEIAHVTTESVDSFDDYEAARSVTASYRIRVVRTDGAQSDWSSSVTARPEAAHAEIAFVSNSDPTLDWIAERPSTTDYTFLSAGDVVLRRMYGRDHSVAFVPTEDRGVSFQLALTTVAGDQPAAGEQGVAGFDALRALAAADLPYVCVLDHQGNRFYANVTVPKGTVRLTPIVYVGVVNVTTVAGEPWSVEVTA